MTEAQQTRFDTAMRTLVTVILELVKATKNPFGMPGGKLYAILMPTGCPIDFFELLMSRLVESGMLVKAHQCYSPGPKFPLK